MLSTSALRLYDQSVVIHSRPTYCVAGCTLIASCDRLSCCVAGNCDLEVQESHVKETLELLGERLDHPQPQADYPPFVPHSHPLSYVEIALRYSFLPFLVLLLVYQSPFAACGMQHNVTFPLCKAFCICNILQCSMTRMHTQH